MTKDGSSTRQGFPPQRLRNLPMVVERLKAVSEFRAKSKRPDDKAACGLPECLRRNGRSQLRFPDHPTDQFGAAGVRTHRLAGAASHSEAISSVCCPTLPCPISRLLTSAIHMAWMRAVTGRMKSDYMYSVGVVYNTFPNPPEGTRTCRNWNRWLSPCSTPAPIHPGANTGRSLRPGP